MGGYTNWAWAAIMLFAAAIVMLIAPGLAIIAIIVAAVALVWVAVLAVGAIGGGRGRSDTELEHDEYLERNPGDAKHMRYDAKS
ncbi:MAG: hypothetical protein JWN72_2092 [Thermoleophilia bacterium]|nr:hypothetical protein [Thermoleophilia bacterium]